MEGESYFGTQVDWDGRVDYDPEFRHMPDIGGLDAAPGLVLRPFQGRNLMASYATFGPGVQAPLHQHVQEQLTVVISGSLEFTVGNKTRWMRPGDIVSIPPMVPHAAKGGEGGAVAIDMFSPPRDGFQEMVAPRA